MRYYPDFIYKEEKNMPYPEKHESGAIVFKLTNDEQDVRNLKTELEEMKAELAKELTRVKKIKK